MPTRRNPSWVYILHCADGTYYTGCTTNLEQRVYDHQTGRFPGYTKKHRPVNLIWFEEFRDLNEAIDAERPIKGWSRAKKEALMSGDFDLLHELACSEEMENENKRKEIDVRLSAVKERSE